MRLLENKISVKQLAHYPTCWCRLAVMTNTKKILLATSALTICAVLAPGLGSASAKPGKAAATPVVKNIYLQGNSQDGWFWWADQKTAGDVGFSFSTYRDISVKSGSTRFFFIWGNGSNNPGYHNVSLKKTGSNLAWRTGLCSTSSCTKTTLSTLLKFTNSSTRQNTGTTDYKYPTAGWVPTAPSKKKALYSLICTLHTNMVMRVYVQG